MATTNFTTGTVITSDWCNDVDEHVYDTGVTKHKADEVEVVPAGNITATDVQAALEELDSLAQQQDATLASIALLGTAANKYLYTTGVDTWAEGNITVAGRALLGDADAAAQRATLDLEVGTDVMAHVAPGTSGNILTSDGSAWVSASTPNVTSPSSALIPKWVLYPGSGTSFDYLGFPTLTGTGTIAAAPSDGTIYAAMPGGVKASTAATANTRAGFFVNTTVASRHYTRALIRFVVGGAPSTTDHFVGFTSSTTIPAGTVDMEATPSGLAGLLLHDDNFFVLAPSGVATPLGGNNLSSNDLIVEIITGSGDTIVTLYEYRATDNTIIKVHDTTTANGAGTDYAQNPLVWTKAVTNTVASITLAQFYVETKV